MPGLVKQCRPRSMVCWRDAVLKGPLDDTKHTAFGRVEKQRDRKEQDSLLSVHIPV